MPHQFRPNPDHPAVDYLVRLHAELGGLIEKSRQEARRLADQMRAVEATIHLFDPNYDVRAIAARRRQSLNKWFKRGHMFREVISILKTAPEPVTTADLARAVIASQGEHNPDTKALKNMEGAVRSCLNNHAGKTVENVAQGIPAKWRLIPVC